MTDAAMLKRAMNIVLEGDALEARDVLFAIAGLGVRLNELGGADLMYDAYSEVFRASPDRAELLNDMWEGIGEWVRPQ